MSLERCTLATKREMVTVRAPIEARKQKLQTTMRALGSRAHPSCSACCVFRGRAIITAVRPSHLRFPCLSQLLQIATCVQEMIEKDKRERGAANGKLQIGCTACGRCGGISPRSAEPTGPLWFENARIPSCRIYACRTRAGAFPPPRDKGQGYMDSIVCTTRRRRVCPRRLVERKQRYVGITEYVVPRCLPLDCWHQTT